MATTYLQLTNRVLNTLNETLLTESTFGTTSDGFANFVKEAINQAIFDVHTQVDVYWPFAWHKTTFNTTIGETEYTPISGATSIQWTSFRIIGDGTSITSSKLKEIDYQVYAENQLSKDEDLETGNYAKPKTVIRSPNNSIIISTCPDSVYEVEYQYYSIPTALSVYSSTTNIPDEFTQIIIDKALYFAYMFRDNLELAQLQQDRYERNVTKMRMILIPQFKSITNLI
jgi:hypothetical protein